MKIDDLVPSYSPTLVSLLLRSELKKGSPLTEEEVYEIRDNATVLMVPESTLEQAAQQRGYFDIDPDECWERWQAVRLELAAKKLLE